MAGVLLAALDQMIVSTAMPSIARAFDDFERYPWIVTSYLLASTASMPLYGKISDLFGRRPVVLFAIGTFLLGSLLAGAAPTMTLLIVSRAIQGLGAGGLMSLAFTVISDVVPARERGRYQAMFGAVFGLASIVGPLVGGPLAGYNWRWIFYVNLPLGLAALVLCSRVLRLVPHQRRERRIDWAGAVLLVAGVCALLLALSWGGVRYPWSSGPVVGLFVTGAVLAVAFVAGQARAAEPILPLRLFRRAAFSLGNAAGFVLGFCMFAAIVYIPLYLQIVKGSPPAESGLLMVPMMVGFIAASLLAGRLISRFGRYKWLPVSGAAATLVGLALLSGLRAETPLWHSPVYLVVIGLGLGLAMQPLVLAVQSAADPRDVGAGTSAATFFRSLGGSVGVAALGAVMTNRLSAELGAAALAGGAQGEPTSLRVDDLAGTGLLAGPLGAAVREAFVDALHPVFLVAAGAAVLAVALTLAMPDRALPAPDAAARPLPETGYPIGATGGEPVSRPRAASEDPPEAARAY